MFQVIVESFFGKESRLVLAPLRTSQGGSSLEGETHETEAETAPGSLAQVSAPPGTGGGGGPIPVGSDNLTKESNFKPRNPTVFHARARNKLRRLAAAAENMDSSQDNYLFLTGTLPSVEIAAWNELATQSGAIVNSLNSWLSKKLNRRIRFFYCWERQKRGALHLHYCCHIEDKTIAKDVLNQWQNWWTKRLLSIQESSGVKMCIGKGGVDWSLKPEKIQAVAQVVVKSVGRYMSKYVTKASPGEKNAVKLGLLAPRRWWGASRDLDEELQRNTDRYVSVQTSYLPAKNLFDKTRDVLRVSYESHGKTYELPSTIGYIFTVFGDESCRNRLTQLLPSKFSKVLMPKLGQSVSDSESSSENTELTVSLALVEKIRMSVERASRTCKDAFFRLSTNCWAKMWSQSLKSAENRTHLLTLERAVLQLSRKLPSSWKIPTFLESQPSLLEFWNYSQFLEVHWSIPRTSTDDLSPVRDIKFYNKFLTLLGLCT